MAAFNTRSIDIKDFVNVRGGSLIALVDDKCSLSVAYKWLPVQLVSFPDTSSTVNPTAYFKVPTTIDIHSDHLVWLLKIIAV